MFNYKNIYIDDWYSIIGPKEKSDGNLKKYNLRWCEVQLSYAIGIEKPLAIYVNSDKGILDVNDKLYDECKPRNIIKDLNLKNTKYENLAMFGHFR